MILRGKVRVACTFINPNRPNFRFSEKVSQTTIKARTNPVKMQTHWFIPARYMTIKTTNVPSSPPAKMNRYWLCSPLNSAGLFTPLLMKYSAILFTERMSVEWWQQQSEKYRRQTRRQRFCRCPGRRLKIWNTLLRHRLSQQWLQWRRLIWLRGRNTK